MNNQLDAHEVTLYTQIIALVYLLDDSFLQSSKEFIK